MNEPSHGHHGGSVLGLPPIGKAVKCLLVMNLAVFVLQLFFDRGIGPMSRALGVTVGDFWQVYRYVTFQFLHSPGDIWHILLNMLGLYVLGSPLERMWGSRRFVCFYLSCGVAAGVAFVLIGALGGLPYGRPIVGASGGVYGLILAAAVYLPQMYLIFLFFPVPIRLAAIIIFGAMSVTILTAAARGATTQAMSDVAHMGGAVAAAVWIWVVPRLGRRWPTRLMRHRPRKGVWDRKMRRQAAEEAEIDRILKKIHDHGIVSLSRKEKRHLQEATRRQQREEEQVRF